MPDFREDRKEDPDEPAAQPASHDLSGLPSQRMIDRGLSSLTVRYTHSVLRSTIRQAIRWRLLLQDPTDGAQLPRLRRREIQVLTYVCEPDSDRRRLSPEDLKGMFAKSALRTVRDLPTASMADCRLFWEPEPRFVLRRQDECVRDRKQLDSGRKSSSARRWIALNEGMPDEEKPLWEDKYRFEGVADSRVALPELTRLGWRRIKRRSPSRSIWV